MSKSPGITLFFEAPTYFPSSAPTLLGKPGLPVMTILEQKIVVLTVAITISDVSFVLKLLLPYF